MTRLGANVTTSHFFLTYLLARLTWAKMTRMRGSGFMMAVWWIFTFLFTFWWIFPCRRAPVSYSFYNCKKLPESMCKGSMNHD